MISYFISSGESQQLFSISRTCFLNETVVMYKNGCTTEYVQSDGSILKSCGYSCDYNECNIDDHSNPLADWNVENITQTSELQKIDTSHFPIIFLNYY